MPVTLLAASTTTLTGAQSSSSLTPSSSASSTSVWWRRHLLARAAVEAGDLFGALADRGAAGVHGGEAAADDRDLLADVHVAGELELAEEVDRGDHAVGVLAVDPHVVGVEGAHGEEDGVEVLVEEVLELVVDAEARIDLQLDAHAPEHVELLLEEVARQAIAGDAVAQHPARLGQSLEDLDGVALEPGVEGAGQTGRPAADDGDALARVGLRLDRQQELAGLLLVDALVGHETVHPADGDRVLHELPAARPFAGARADAAEDRGEGQVLAQLADPVLVVLLGDVLEELRDLDVRRTSVAAGRRAERVVVGEQQLEIEVPHRPHSLGAGVYDHALGRRRGAARQRLARALDLDHADAAGGRGRQARLVAQGRDVDADPLRGLEDRLTELADDLLVVDGQRDLVGAHGLLRPDVVGRRRHARHTSAIWAMPERIFTASNLQTWRQVSHLMQPATSMTWGCFLSPAMTLVGHFLAQRPQPVQASASMV